MELPQLDAPPSFDGKGRRWTNCGIGKMRGSELRKGLPFGSPTLCTDDARGERSWHYCFGTKDPNLCRLSPAGGWRIPISLAIAAVWCLEYLYRMWP